LLIPFNALALLMFIFCGSDTSATLMFIVSSPFRTIFITNNADDDDDDDDDDNIIYIWVDLGGKRVVAHKNGL
jgi:hypothetical protein